MPDPDQHNTSIAGWSFALARALEHYGIDSHRVFSEAGIDLGAVPSAAARLPVARVQQVWRYAMDNTDDLFGITMAGFITPASFHSLGFAMWCSSTLKEALERMIRYRCVLSHMHFSELLEEEGGFRLTLIDQRTLKSGVTNEAFLGFVVLLAQQLSGPDFAPRALHSRRSGQSPGRQLREFFATDDIQFGADAYALQFDRESLVRPLPYANPELARQLDAMVERYIAELDLISEHRLRVRNHIHKLLETGAFSVERVAAAMNVTVRTLQRRLAAENSSYHALLDEVRSGLARQYLGDPANSATDIAFRLGFNDSGSFGRSFKRWTGLSISEFREGAKAKKKTRRDTRPNGARGKLKPYSVKGGNCCVWGVQSWPYRARNICGLITDPLAVPPRQRS